MKAKSKFDSAKLKQFFILHGEKVGLAVIGLCFLWLCYAAVRVEKYDKDEKALEAATASADQNIANSKVKLLDEDPPVKLPDPDFTTRIAQYGPLAAERFAWAAPANRPLFEIRVRRGEPIYLTARNLKGSTGYGPVEVKVGNNKQVRGEKWVVLTALVPLAEQQQEYRKLFDSAVLKDKNRDTPFYLGFELQRAEVSSADPDEDLEGKWKMVNLARAIERENQWTGLGKDVVDAAYHDAKLTRPVPPLDKAAHDASVAHPPEIPVAGQEAAAQPETPAEPTEPQAEPAPETPQFGPFGTQPQAQPHAAAPRPLAGGPPKQVEYRLLRFFDFDIEPTKTYRYRVRLGLRNPNLGLAPQFLQDPKLADGDFRATEWSEPSPPVYVPRSHRFLAGSMKPAMGSQEPRATFIVRKWDEAAAIDAATEVVDLTRGTLVNFKQQKVKNSSQLVDFVTDELLVDITGGDRLPVSGRPINAPGEVLFMRANGELAIRSQVDDAGEYEEVAKVARIEQDRRRPREPATGTRRPSGADPFDIGDPFSGLDSPDQ